MAGILGSVYRALDPILPFDRYLDSRFGILGDVPSRMPAGGVLGGLETRATNAPKNAAYAPPPAPQSVPELAGGPPPAQSINPRMGFPTMDAPRMGAASQGAPQTAPRRTNGWRVLDRVLGGSTITDALDTERARPLMMEDAARKRAREVEEDAIARRVFADDERGYLAWRANREKAGEALSSGLEDYTLAPGGVRGRAGETLQRAPFAPINASPGTQVIDPTTRKVIAQAPFKPEVVTAPMTSSVTVVDPNAPGGGPSVGERNNNPGNLEDGEFARLQPGYVGTDGRFARFATPEAGAAAQETLLTNAYIGRGQNTIQSIIEGVPDEGGRRIHGYSPRQSDGGDNTDEQVNNYIGYVASRTGLRPGDPVPADKVAAVAAAMREFETGQRPGGQGGGTRVVQQGVAKPDAGSRPATAEEKAAYGVDPDTPAAMVDGKFTVLTAAAKANSTTAKLAASRRSALAKAQTVIRGIDQAEALVSPMTVGFGSLLEGVPTSPARALKAQVDFIKANIGFDALQEMRANSPTGGALGQVAVQELGYLQASLASLDTGQSEPEFKRALAAVREHYQRYLDILKQEAAAEDQGSGPVPPAGRTASSTSPTAGAPRTTKPPVQVRTLREAEALPKGTVFTLNGRRGVNR